MVKTLNKILYFIILSLIVQSCAKPIADFTMSANEVKAPSNVQFTNDSKKAESYFWDFGDGNTSDQESPGHKYYLSGKYTVKLTAKKGKKMSEIEKEIIVEAPHDCTVEMETTAGTITIRLSDATPAHRDNFIKLAESGYFDGTLFHRVIDGFMIQGGDPDSKGAPAGKRLGMGGPGYTVPAEFVDTLVHVKGALAAARQGDQVNPEKRSSGSQFYIVDGKPASSQELDIMEARKGIKYTKEIRDIYNTIGGTPFLDMEYTVFGQVVKGLDVIDNIASVRTDGADRPTEDVIIKHVKVIK
ncbi:MAG TPA: peptidylprolyl isomerase [Saprospiraceae bacterium]|nr:peptidylprolyl isomerase [Saprospiraceae bacterium]